ncbi:hypothetical protein TNCV_3261381 [Trichonephila clavipes]|nr:hypothetical protein TNCV_3261381 [Trichonephila clavipes]
MYYREYYLHIKKFVAGGETRDAEHGVLNKKKRQTILRIPIDLTLEQTINARRPSDIAQFINSIAARQR